MLKELVFFNFGSYIKGGEEVNKLTEKKVIKWFCKSKCPDRQFLICSKEKCSTLENFLILGKEWGLMEMSKAEKYKAIKQENETHYVPHEHVIEAADAFIKELQDIIDEKEKS